MNQNTLIEEDEQSNKDETEISLIEKLREKLEKIKGQNGISGYILRDHKSACVDLEDPTRIIEYATLSYETMQTADKISQKTYLGKIYKVILEGNDKKILSVNNGDCYLNVFMNKNVDHNKVHRELGLDKC